MKYLSVEQAAKKWNLSARSVRNYCKQGRVPFAFLDGKTWKIREDAEKPVTYIINANKKLLTWLKEEKKYRIPGRMYNLLQIDMAYNSNRIEGSRLSHEQTRMIFETNTVGFNFEDRSSLFVDDIIEMKNHFNCFDYVIDNAKKELSEAMIKKLHYLLKQNTSDAAKIWFKVGDYKIIDNFVGGRKTTSVVYVRDEMKKLVDEYNSKQNITINDIIDFHYKFERIHPFQDGNGRVGRLIMLKECLKHNFVPILIKDEFKQFYYRGLKEYEKEKGYLIDTCLHGQDIVSSYLDYFKIKH